MAKQPKDNLVIEEISYNEIGGHAHCFSSPQAEMVIASVAAGNTSAQLWRSTGDNSRSSYLLWDKGNNVFYLSGNALSRATADEIRTLIRTYIAETASREGRRYFKAQGLSSSFTEVLPDLFQGIELYKTEKLFYVFRKQAPPSIPAASLENVTYRLIDAGFLESDQYQNVQQVKAEVDWMWVSRARFAIHGFGYAALLEDNIVCWCTAEYVSERKCGIGIETVQANQNKGVATATAAHFVDHCIRHHITPHWECDSQNMGSIRVAEKVGFERIQESTVWNGYFPR